MDPKLTQDPYRILVLQVARKLDELGCKAPTIEVPLMAPMVTARCHPSSVDLFIDPQARNVSCNGGNLTKLVAPSHWAAVAFIVAVESVRQQKANPRVKFATGQGVSKFNWGDQQRLDLTLDSFCEARMESRTPRCAA